MNRWEGPRSILDIGGLDIATLGKIIGASVKSAVPPFGFDPLAASQAELSALWFPTRPDPALPLPLSGPGRAARANRTRTG